MTSWKCSEKKCFGQCASFGDPHYHTFDGKFFTYEGSCHYVLVQNEEEKMSVIVRNADCGFGNACVRRIMIILGKTNTTLTLGGNFQLLVNGMVTGLPYNGLGLTVQMISSNYMKVRMGDKFSIWYDANTKVYVNAHPDYQNKLDGMCGIFNQKERDDFTTREGIIESSAMSFGDSWRTDSNCKPAPPLRDTCNEQPQRAALAEQKCNLLKKDPFKKCHSKVSPDIYIDMCLRDVCACTTGASCLCLTQLTTTPLLAHSWVYTAMALHKHDAPVVQAHTSRRHISM
jgi:integrin beta 3